MRINVQFQSTVDTNTSSAALSATEHLNEMQNSGKKLATGGGAFPLSCLSHEVPCDPNESNVALLENNVKLL